MTSINHIAVFELNWTGYMNIPCRSFVPPNWTKLLFS